MRSILIIGLACSLLTGCFKSGQTIPINMDFASTNYGFLNSGDYKAGSFFLWDKEADTLSYLGVVPGFDTPEHPRDKTRDFASYSGGVDLGGGIKNPAIETSANVLIKSRSSFEIAYPNRVAYNRVYSKITDYLTPDITDDGELMDEWKFRVAAKDPNKVYVLARDVTYGDGITLLVDGEAQVGGAFSMPIKGYDVNIELTGRSLQDIQGTNTEVAFNVYVLDPYWKQENGVQTPAFEVIHGVDKSDLPRLLRKIATHG